MPCLDCPRIFTYSCQEHQDIIPVYAPAKGRKLAVAAKSHNEVRHALKTPYFLDEGVGGSLLLLGRGHRGLVFRAWVSSDGGVQASRHGGQVRIKVCSVVQGVYNRSEALLRPELVKSK